MREIYPLSVIGVAVGESNLVHLAHATVRRQRLLLLQHVRLGQSLKQVRNVLILRLEAQRQFGVVKSLADIAQLLSSQRPPVQRLRIGTVEFQRYKRVNLIITYIYYALCDSDVFVFMPGINANARSFH